MVGPVDFDRFVISVCENTFARPCIINPIKSNPTAAPYVARGIFSSRPLNIALAEGGVIVDQQTTFDIRIADFTGPLPQEEDRITFTAPLPPGYPDGQVFWVASINKDGQGAAQMTLRTVDE